MQTHRGIFSCDEKQATPPELGHPMWTRMWRCLRQWRLVTHTCRIHFYFCNVTCDTSKTATRLFTQFDFSGFAMSPVLLHKKIPLCVRTLSVAWWFREMHLSSRLSFSFCQHPPTFFSHTLPRAIFRLITCTVLFEFFLYFRLYS